MELEGKGVVNYDSKEQQRILNAFGIKGFGGVHSNVSFAKKNFYEKDDGVMTYKLKISSDCLKNAIFGKDVVAQSPNIVHHKNVFYSFLSSPYGIMKGYLFAEKEETLKRKSAFTIFDAEQICDAKSQIETFSRSGKKTEKDIEINKSDNTFFKKETIGDVRYQTMGNIDLMNLQFVSADLVFDRYALNPDYFSLYKKYILRRLPNFNSELGYYQIKNSYIEIPEYGFVFSNNDLVELVKITMKRLLKLYIRRSAAFASVSSLKVKLVDDVLTDTFKSEEGWVDIFNERNVDDLLDDVEFEMFYELIDENDAEQQRNEINEEVKRLKNIAKDEAKNKKSKASKKSEDDEQ